MRSPLLTTGLFVLLIVIADRNVIGQFVDVTAQSGISYTQRQSDGANDLSYEPQLMTGGAAAGDFDGDGFVDLFVTRLDAPSILYRNQGNGTFQALTNSTVGLDVIDRGNGGTWGDVDNDGDLDLYVTSVQNPSVGGNRNYLLINNGQWGQGTGGFQEVAVQRNVGLTNASSDGANYSSTFGDYDGDGYLDLYTSSWRDSGGSASRLYRNAGAANPGYFVDVTASAGVSMATVSNNQRSYAFAPRFSDLNNDGRLDLAITGDFGTSRLFWNNGDGTFTDGTVAAGVGTDENGMGATIADFNGDGLQDWFVTSVYDNDDDIDFFWGGSGNRLYTNNGDQTFSDTTTAAGVRDGGWGWGTSAFDYDNDGYMDIVMTNGFPTDLLASLVPGDVTDFSEDTMRLFRNLGDGTFEEVAVLAGLTDTGKGTGLLTMDYDADGDLDVFGVNNAGEPVLYRNDLANGNDWLQVDLQLVGANVDGIGALIQLTSELDGSTQYKEVNAGSNFLGQDDSLAHFGLGDLDSLVAELRILIPINDGSGEYDEYIFNDIAPNQRFTFNQQTGLLILTIPEPSALLACFACVGGFALRRTRLRSE